MTTQELDDLSKMDEAQLRAVTVPVPNTIEELNDIIKAVIERDHDYRTCPYGISIAATATLFYVSRVLGVTAFQAGFADFDILRRSRC